MCVCGGGGGGGGVGDGIRGMLIFGRMLCYHHTMCVSVIPVRPLMKHTKSSTNSNFI